MLIVRVGVHSRPPLYRHVPTNTTVRHTIKTIPLVEKLFMSFTLSFVGNQVNLSPRGRSTLFQGKYALKAKGKKSILTEIVISICARHTAKGIIE